MILEFRAFKEVNIPIPSTSPMFGEILDREKLACYEELSDSWILDYVDAYEGSFNE